MEISLKLVSFVRRDEMSVLEYSRQSGRLFIFGIYFLHRCFISKLLDSAGLDRVDNYFY